LERVFIKHLFENKKDVKENSGQWTDRDSNSQGLKIDKVGKHSRSTKIITANKLSMHHLRKMHCQRFILKNYTTLSNPSG